ncbi:universal stress protein [Haloplanus aerogenes]|uniref:Nucleotide-binding universal stress UspA family protein n=1 Tax=Haloplanus aerogenes TaxID=660522 RepID=A0A3M0E1S0_9EURY|nr:universal stress protein [Haloplanus aerogenes]AZH25756.1 universal stress protein [Haloplanus aerogenes]RMB25493.1 nucleotide-binding universal stress UspA family protein [Haloplanus aerogenes]
MTDHVLVPVDGSPLSFDALRHAFREFPDASITVLHVIDLFDPGYGTAADTTYEPMLGSEEWYAQVEDHSEGILDDASQLAADYDREVETVSEIGDPGRIVVDYATEEPIDHVVMGTHGRPDAERTLFGSVADVVVRRAPVPVTLVR